MEKRLILIRHAHRDTNDRQADNGLSPKGLRQAKRLVRYGRRLITPEDFVHSHGQILSSPKRRCVETVEGLAQNWKTNLICDPCLTEKQEGETFADFNERIHGFLKKWQKGPQRLTVLCGHGDWLPLAAFHLIGVAIEMKKGAWLDIRWQECHGELAAYIPTFRPFFKA